MKPIQTQIREIRHDMRLFAQLATESHGARRAHYTAQFRAAQREVNRLQLSRDNAAHARVDVSA